LLSRIKSIVAGKKHLQYTEDSMVLYGKQRNGAGRQTLATTWRFGNFGDFGDKNLYG